MEEAQLKQDAPSFASIAVVVILLSAILSLAVTCLYVWDVASDARHDARQALASADIARSDLELLREQFAAL